MKFIFSFSLVFLFLNTEAQSIKEYYDIGEYSKAIETFQSIESPSTDDEIILAKTYAAKGMTLKCLKTYESAFSDTKADKFITSKFQYAKILQTQGRLKKADSIYSRLLEVLPENAEFMYQKGKIAEDFEELGYHQFFLSALLYDPTHIKAAHEASRYFMEVDNLSMAKNICLKTLELVPNTPRLINLMAQIHYRKDDYAKSLAYIKQLEKLKSDLPKFIFEIKGNIYLKQKLYKKAFKAYEMAYSKDNKDYNLCLKLGEIAIIIEDYDKAGRYLFLYERMRDTSMWEFNYLRGQLYLKRKEYRMAFYQFERALKENISHEASRYYRAIAADNFAEDKAFVLDYYTNYIEFFEDEKDAKFVELALRRETEIRRELFMKE